MFGAWLGIHKVRRKAWYFRYEFNRAAFYRSSVICARAKDGRVVFDLTWLILVMVVPAPKLLELALIHI